MKTGGYTHGNGESNKEKLILDPNLRQKYIDMLGLYRIDVECEEESPFYNYEFYATPDETGAIGANSVIIAERYYQNKYNEKTFAINNATYFFKYKDFLVLSNLQKKDMMEERENIVFRASHTVTTQKRQGKWAKSVLDNVLRTMMGSDLKGLTENEKRQKLINKMKNMYLKEEIDEIFKLCEEIDSGECTLVANKITNKGNKDTGSPNFDDDEER